MAQSYDGLIRPTFDAADNPDPASAVTNPNGRFYLPASGAGAPPISPAFDSSWGSTAGASRVVGRFRRKYGTAVEDITVTPSLTLTKLVRQYVIPFADILSTGLGDNAFGFTLVGAGSGFSTYILAKGPAVANVSLLSTSRIVDSSGTDIATSDFATGGTAITATVTAGSYLMASAGAFTAAMAGCSVGVSNGGAFVNRIVQFISASSVVLQYPFLAPEAGNQTVFVYSKGQQKSNGSTGDAITGTTIAIYGVDDISGIGGGDVIGEIDPSWYLVKEIGITAGSTTTTNTLRFGDPSDNVLIYDTLLTSGSCGSVRVYYEPAPLFL